MSDHMSRMVTLRRPRFWWFRELLYWLRILKHPYYGKYVVGPDGIPRKIVKYDGTRRVATLENQWATNPTENDMWAPPKP